MAEGVLSPGVNLEAFSQAIAAIQALRSSVTRVFDCLKDGMRNKETLEGREKSFVACFQESLHSVSRDLSELERLSNLVGKPSENHPLHNSGLLSLDPVQDKTPLYSQLLQAYKWSNKAWRWLQVQWGRVNWAQRSSLTPSVLADSFFASSESSAELPTFLLVGCNSET
ncbi:mediator of RNA polymerase II transcription subunit 27 isoform X3 [Terrapene carolina triunguis]|uniref:mediator of RNA polymerase II transcription subunit 27 isoform X3 n=1 Tax=Terrapene triunguis TaxID=2587831 RepID=UPI000E77D725|nr:mediator of RNA polymerase II transcription subunit 27 isoform X3 [Terrapene carolina triunguis]